MKRGFILLIAGIVLGLPIITEACSDRNDFSEEIVSYDIVKLETQNELLADFTLQKPRSSEMVTYRSIPLVDTNLVKIGQCLRIAYIPKNGVPYTSGGIILKGYQPINNDTLRSGRINNYPDWNRDPVYLLSAWLSGDYLNVHCRLAYDEAPRVLRLLADSLSIDDPMPECYLMHTLKEPVNSFMRAYYISFDISALRAKEGCRGLRLRLNNSNLPVDTVVVEF